MFKTLTAIVFMFFVSSACAQQLVLSSDYSVAGTNANGSRYSGTISLKPISDTTFAVRWNIAGTIYRGFGIRLKNFMSATYTINGRPGLIMYEGDQNGRLRGVWAVRGVNGKGTEILTPVQ